MTKIKSAHNKPCFSEGTVGNLGEKGREGEGEGEGGEGKGGEGRGGREGFFGGGVGGEGCFFVVEKVLKEK